MILEPTIADIEAANRAVSVIEAPDGTPFDEMLCDMFNGISTDQEDIIEKIEYGGTLRKSELQRIDNSEEMLFALGSLQEFLSESTGIDFTRQASIKVYGPRKPGMAPHRDSDQPRADESVNAVMGIYGQRETGLWIVPRDFRALAEPGRRDPRFRAELASELPGVMNGVECSVRPYRAFVPQKGEVVVIDERQPKGIWRSATMGPVALKHSCRPLTPAASVVCRSYDRVAH